MKLSAWWKYFIKFFDDKSTEQLPIDFNFHEIVWLNLVDVFGLVGLFVLLDDLNEHLPIPTECQSVVFVPCQTTVLGGQIVFSDQIHLNRSMRFLTWQMLSDRTFGCKANADNVSALSRFADF